MCKYVQNIFQCSSMLSHYYLQKSSACVVLFKALLSLEFCRIQISAGSPLVTQFLRGSHKCNFPVPRICLQAASRCSCSKLTFHNFITASNEYWLL